MTRGLWADGGNTRADDARGVRGCCRKTYGGVPGMRAARPTRRHPATSIRHDGAVNGMTRQQPAHNMLHGVAVTGILP